MKEKYTNVWDIFIFHRHGELAARILIAGSCLWLGSVAYMWVDEMAHRTIDRDARIIAEAFEKNRAEQTQRIVEALENGQSHSRFTSVRKGDTGGDSRIN